MRFQCHSVAGRVTSVTSNESSRATPVAGCAHLASLTPTSRTSTLARRALAVGGRPTTVVAVSDSPSSTCAGTARSRSCRPRWPWPASARRVGSSWLSWSTSIRRSSRRLVVNSALCSSPASSSVTFKRSSYSQTPDGRNAFLHLSRWVVFVILAKPGPVVCGIQRFGVGVGFAVTYAALLTKTNRISRIFNSARHSAKRPPFISPRSQVIRSV